MKKELVQAYTLRISQANPSEIIAIVYALAGQYLSDAQEAYDAGEIPEFTDACHGAKRCLNHLLQALDDAQELSVPLANLYIYFNKEISMGCARRDMERLLTVKRQISELEASFVELAKQDGSNAVMQNPQAVYAGLTYGREQLNESLYDYDTDSRGFRA